MGLAVVLALACAAPERAREVGPPPVVLIVADTLRADRLGSYGSTEGHTPGLDAIASQGVTIDPVIAPAPWTQPSIASLFSGTYPGVHGVTRYRSAVAGAMRGEPQVPVLGGSFDTLAEALRRGGYETAAFVANPFVARDFGFGQGFDHFTSPSAHERWPGAELNRAALAWLDARDGTRPPFLYLHYMDAHGPWEAAPERLDPLLDAVAALPEPTVLTLEQRERLDYLWRLPRGARDPARHARLSRTLEYWQARYDAAVRELDAQVAALVAALEERGLWQHALVVFTADHGEALLDRGLWDHGFSVQGAELHVPLLWRWPGELPAGLRVAGAAGLVDVLPTLLDLLSLPPIPDAQGRSLADALRGGPLPETAVFAQAVKSGPEQQAVYRGGYKLEQVLGREAVEDRLYTIAEDPLETEDVGSRHAQTLDALRAALDDFRRDNAARRKGAAGVAPVDPARRRQLEALGYLGADPDAD